MNLNPQLGTIDRIGSLAIGVGAVAYAVLGQIDQTWARIVLAGLGVAMAVGGIGGT